MNHHVCGFGINYFCPLQGERDRWAGPILLKRMSHQGNSVPNGSVKIFARHVPLYQQAHAPFCLAKSHSSRGLILVKTITATCGLLAMGTKFINTSNPDRSGTSSSAPRNQSAEAVGRGPFPIVQRLLVSDNQKSNSSVPLHRTLSQLRSHQ